MKAKKYKEFTPEEITEVIQEAKDESQWDLIAEVTQNESPNLIYLHLDDATFERLKKVADYHGLKGFQRLLKTWVLERLNFEYEILMKMLDKKKKKTS